MYYKDPKALFMTFKQTGPTHRTIGDNTNYSGFFLATRLDPMEYGYTWRREMPMFGFSASLVYKDFGNYDGNILVGGAIDYNKNENASDTPKWRLGIMRITESGNTPHNGDSIVYLGQSSETGDWSGHAPYIDHMHLDDKSVVGEDWLFGTAKSSDPAQSGDLAYIFKVLLDDHAHSPTQDSLVLKKLELSSSGYVVAVLQTL